MRTVIIDLAISIDVCLTDHLVDLLVRELLACTQKSSPMSPPKKKIKAEPTETSHDMPQLCRRDKPVAVLVEHLERLLYFLLRIRVAHLARHHGEKFGKVDRAVAIRVDLVDHVL
jgi:hypothetical protein